MNKLNMYCISLEPSHLGFIKELDYIPVGLGKKNFQKEWMRDNTGNNISKKKQKLRRVYFSLLDLEKSHEQIKFRLDWFLSIP